MIGIFMLAVAGLTSAAVYLLGVRPFGLCSSGAVSTACGRALT